MFLHLACFLVLIIFNFVTCFIVPPSVRYSSNIPDPSVTYFLSFWIQNTSSDVAGGLLVTDVDLDGQLDVYFVTLDGELHGRLGFVQCYVQKECNERETHWPVLISGERFVTKPVAIPIDEYGRSVIGFVSSRGTIFVFDHLGNPVNKIHIPSVTVRLSNERTHVLPIIGASNLFRRVRWTLSHSGVMRNSIADEYILYPRIYADALVLSASEAVQSLIFPVTFISSDETDHNLLLSAIVGLSHHKLIHNSWMESREGSHDQYSTDNFTLVPLELTQLNQTQPGFLLSELSIASLPSLHYVRVNKNSPLAPDRLAYMVIIPSFSGLLHRVLLPLHSVVADKSSIRHTFIPVVADGVISSLASSCLLIDCPVPTQPSSDQLSGLCCLLLDTSSRLHSINLSGGWLSTLHHSAQTRTTTKTSLLWSTYNASNGEESVPSLPTFGDVSLVPGCIDHLTSNCDPWAVFPTPDGMVHAVNVRNGSSVFGYPVRVLNSQNLNSSSQSFTSGRGLPYTDVTGTLWMLFSDTHGNLYHVCLHQFPIIVKRSMICSTFDGVKSCAHSVPQSVNWLSPIWIRTSQDLSAHQTDSSIETSAILWPTNHGLLLLDVPQLHLFHANWMIRHPGRVRDLAPVFMPHIQYGITFVDVHRPHQFNGKNLQRLKSTQTVFRLNYAEQSHVLFYQLTDCPFTRNNDYSGTLHTTDYLIKLTDSLGNDISAWSIPKVDMVTNFSALCSGQLEIILPFSSSFHGRVYFHVVEQRTGRLLPSSNPTFNSPFANTAGSVILDGSTAWPQLLLILTYMPGLYLFLGLLFLLNQNVPKDVTRHSSSGFSFLSHRRQRRNVS